MLRIKKPVTFAAAFLVASFLLFVNAQPLVQEGMPMSPKGKMHDWLAESAGTWTFEGVMHSPMGEMEFTGTETVTVDLGGLWVFGNLETEIMGMPFTGRSVTGYDPETKKFVGAWVDSMTPRIVQSEGTREGDTLVMHSEGTDPETGKTFPEKQIERRIGADKREFKTTREVEGADQVTMEITYTRKKN